MTQSITIPKEVPQNSALSYDFLREEGIALLQQMAGATWTDHNIHDPGITILEQVCYAITDLAYRMDYDIQDLLGADGSSSYQDLYSAATILTVNPVTMLDLRKIVLDVEGVKNVWIEKVPHADPIIDQEGVKQKGLVPKGLYQIFLEKDALFAIAGSKVVSEVRNRLLACRSICEDFDEIILLDTQAIRLQGIIEIADTIEDVNQMVAQMLLRVGSHLSPRIPFYTLQQQVEKGKRTDEIFDGPRLKRGFIEDQDVLNNSRKHDVQTSDIMKELMDEPGVLAIDTLLLGTGANTVKKWLLPLDETKTPVLDIDATLENLSFTSKGLKVGIDKSHVKSIYHQKRGEGLSRITSPKQLDRIQPETDPQNLEQYYTFQNQFPANYGIGEIGLPDSAPLKRKGNAKQLTAYLLFFEQTLANYFSQVANFKQLMSFDGENTSTYFNQSLLTCVPGASEVLGSDENYEVYLKEMTADTSASLLRKNKFLNHLLARFGEKFTGYGMILKDVSTDSTLADKKLIKDKATFLQQYPVVSADRAKAYDYSKAVWDTDNVSGLEKRIALKLGIEDYSRRNLGDGDTAGFHMLEHLMIRPRRTYPFPFKVQYSPVAIEQFEAGSIEENTRCTLGSHSFKLGEAIQISGNELYEGIYSVIDTGEDFIEIKAVFQESAAAGMIQRRPDVRYYIRTAEIENFSASPSLPNHTFCEAKGHKLQLGNQVEITQTQAYNGVHEVVTVSEAGFEIAVPFTETEPTEAEPTGRWMPIAVPNDPYSLQLTFLLPNWIERHQNEDFKKFVAVTIREETPAHLRVNIKWLNQTEMQDADTAFFSFLSNSNTL